MESDLDAEVPGAAGISGPPVLTYTPKTTETPDSTTRKWVSYLLLLLLTTVVLASFVDLFVINAPGPPPMSNAMEAVAADSADATADADRLMRLMNLVFGPVVTLFSSVVGFYFGARTAKESSGG
ncbi:hypothetical protein [Sphingomonas bacterium]|uniref:hypothetical protein n=1 Tax=Sphingomonas bacterium TaxID=1895847 RepID=UPI0015752D6E|nr:hypothetical protein [Sphingomonas bacterium]